MATEPSTRRSSAKKPSRRGSSRTRQTLVPENARHEIYGIALCLAGVALGIAVLSESTGPVPRALAQVVRLAFGVGAYALPIAVILWGASFFVRRMAINEARVGGGIALIVLSVISMVALPVSAETQWQTAVAANHGGYVGGVVAAALRASLGPAIGYVVLTAVLLIGAVLAGMSVSSVVEAVTERFRPGEEPKLAVRPKREPGPKTLPLIDLDADDEPFAKPPATPKQRKAPAEDPESRRKTMPVASTAPRALEGFELPPLQLLQCTPEHASAHKASEKELRDTGQVIESTLATFDIVSRVVGWVPGPTVTMFEVQLAKGIKVNRVTALADDLALSLAAQTVRVLAPIPGKPYIGIEVPNERRSTVTLGDVMSGPALAQRAPLLLGIGKDVAGGGVLADLATMPHLLIAGSTGTGKSVCINALLMSILMRATPAEVRLILIDPKRIELNLYNEVPHLYVPVVTESKEAASALAWAVSEMDGRLKKLQKAGARNIAMYNAAVQEGRAPEGAEELPYLVIVIDELADLMMVAAREVEDSICRIAQLARAAGIHLIVATQRPSTDIITGLIKTNITNRIAFAVGSSIDSRVILDQPGAEKLVGLGDMLFSTPAWPKPKRIQGSYVSEEEIMAVVGHLKAQAAPDYHEEILHLKVSTAGHGGVDDGEDDDPLLWEAADIVLMSGMGSTSLLQRRLKVGYARAGRIMDMLEAKGVVGPPDGSKPRDLLVGVDELEALKAFERRDASEAYGD